MITSKTIKILREPALPCDARGCNGVIIEGVLYEVTDKKFEFHAGTKGEVRLKSDSLYGWEKPKRSEWQPLKPVDDEDLSGLFIVRLKATVPELVTAKEFRTISNYYSVGLWCKVPKLPGEK